MTEMEKSNLKNHINSSHILFPRTQAVAGQEVHLLWADI